MPETISGRAAARRRLTASAPAKLQGLERESFPRRLVPLDCAADAPIMGARRGASPCPAARYTSQSRGASPPSFAERPASSQRLSRSLVAGNRPRGTHFASRESRPVMRIFTHLGAIFSHLRDSRNSWSRSATGAVRRPLCLARKKTPRWTPPSLTPLSPNFSPLCRVSRGRGRR